jgi:hypothetical protein
MSISECLGNENKIPTYLLKLLFTLLVWRACISVEPHQIRSITCAYHIGQRDRFPSQQSIVSLNSLLDLQDSLQWYEKWIFLKRYATGFEITFRKLRWSGSKEALWCLTEPQPSGDAHLTIVSFQRRHLWMKMDLYCGYHTAIIYGESVSYDIPFSRRTPPCHYEGHLYKV